MLKNNKSLFLKQHAWAEYRQALRDVPQQAGFPTEITWPVRPE